MSTNKNNTINTAAANVNAIVDNAFVPDMERKAQQTPDQKMAALFAAMAGQRVSTPVFANPDNGAHAVVMTSYELRNGRHGESDYFILALKDVAKNITWNMTLAAEPEAIMGFLNEVNMYSNGIVFRLEASEAFGRLEAREFNVWTQQYKNDKGELRVKTYCNPFSYERFARFIANKAAEKKEAEKAYKARKNSKKAED